MSMYKAISAFDAETVPDLDLTKKINPELEGATDSEVYQWLGENRNTNRNYPDDPSIFPKILFHKIVTISSATWTNADGFQLYTHGSHDLEKEGDEKQILEDFFETIKSLGGPSKLQLVSFNGKGFDSIALGQRSLIHGVNGEAFFTQKDDAKWNNYIGRYLPAHIDLMDVLAQYSGNGRCRLNDLSIAVGLPGKVGVGGPNVMDAHAKGNFIDINNYCEIDALITILIFYRYLVMTTECPRLLKTMQEDLIEFLESSDHQNPLVSELVSAWEYKEWFIL